MIYLASPYTHPDPAVRDARFHAVCRCAAVMIGHGEMVFSPVAHSHPITAAGLPTDWAFWERFDRVFLGMCSEVVVLTLDGWRESKGVRAEIEIARRMGKPVRFIDPLTDQTPAGAGVVLEAGI